MVILGQRMLSLTESKLLDALSVDGLEISLNYGQLMDQSWRRVISAAYHHRFLGALTRVSVMA